MSCRASLPLPLPLPLPLLLQQLLGRAVTRSRSCGCALPRPSRLHPSLPTRVCAGGRPRACVCVCVCARRVSCVACVCVRVFGTQPLGSLPIGTWSPDASVAHSDFLPDSRERPEWRKVQVGQRVVVHALCMIDMYDVYY